ncbi:MAG: GHKL domain-containing protein, partial [Paraclostridium sp.]|uniref:GHKL domain-containing protein n=1 Tax=Paraclostridium sp. TaxID=2023273 RepID=UPI003F2CD5BD
LLSGTINLKTNKTKLNLSLVICSILITFIEIIVMSLSISLNISLIVVEIPKLIIYITLIFIFLYINYEMSIDRCIVISISYVFALKLIKELIYLFLSVLCNRINEMEYWWYYTLMYDKLVMLEVAVLSKLLLIYLVTVFKILKLKIKFNKKEYRYIFISIIVNLISAILIFTIIYTATQSITNVFLDMIIIGISISTLILNSFFMWLIIRVIKDSNLRAENKSIKDNIDLQYKYYINMQESQLKIKNLYHDMKNHMICIEILYVKNDYITNINNKLEECTSIFNTNNMILDIILNDKKNICQNKGIDLFADINFKECNFIDVADVCSIFSNMIDNAIEACEKIEDKSIDKKIKIKGTVVKKLYIIKCENTKLNKVKLENGKIITDKKDKFLHGIGIRSMKTSVEKYNGNLEINNLENKFLVNICIPLRIENFHLYSQNVQL